MSSDLRDKNLHACFSISVCLVHDIARYSWKQSQKRKKSLYANVLSLIFMQLHQASGLTNDSLFADAGHFV